MFVLSRKKRQNPVICKYNHLFVEWFTSEMHLISQKHHKLWNTWKQKKKQDWAFKSPDKCIIRSLIATTKKSTYSNINRQMLQFILLVIFGYSRPGCVEADPVEIMCHFCVDPRIIGFATFITPAHDSPHIRHARSVFTHQRSSRVALTRVHLPLQVTWHREQPMRNQEPVNQLYTWHCSVK